MILWNWYAMIIYTRQSNQAIKHTTNIYLSSQQDNREKHTFSKRQGHPDYI